jgi:hypothetical protein
MIVPMLLLTFSAIAGWIGRSYGFHNLFRDHPGEFPGMLPNTVTLEAMKLALTASSFQISVYAVTFLGLMWSLALLTYEAEEYPGNTHPILTARSVVWPAILVMALIPIVAEQFAITDAVSSPHMTAELKRQYHVVGFVLSLAGALTGLAIVLAAIYGMIVLSRKTRLPQLFAGILIGFLLILLFVLPAWLMPGFAFFILLSVFVLLYALAVVFPPSLRFPVVLAVLAWGVLCGGIDYRHRFSDLTPYYDAKNVPPSLDSASVCSLRAVSERKLNTPYLIPPLEYLGQWRQEASVASEGRKPYFIVVATTGGGYRATYWTGLVLDKLLAQKFPRNFRANVGLMTGASGGMITTSYFAAMAAAGDFDAGRTSSVVAALDNDIIEASKSRAGSLRRLFRNARRDSLSAMVQQLLQYDLPLSFSPTHFGRDRGSVLQNQWQLISKRKMLSLLPGGGANGFSPAIIYSPLLVDSGRPLLISFLDLSCMATKDTHAVELFRLFPGAEKDVSLATAARMSASFPYIMPAAEIPTAPVQRVVDAGYYDNDGISSAAAFLLTPDIKSWLERNAAGVVIMRVNAFNRATPDKCSGPPEPEKQNALAARIARSLYWLTSPIQGAWVARDTKARFSNRQTIDALALAYPPHFLSEVEFSFDGEAAESWHLPENELDDMRIALGGKDEGGQVDTHASCANAKAFDALTALLSAP